ncbi:V-type proton ATPase subunit G-like [Anthonomus grandis grandis]|uniref:V-type proton ATPase subunit G-like n=1 Tax=Anthonomus grandis grandis TaxID=2921223 RepID=UPI0021658E10|nr:V-type proton ATPase subunit G-like [Anthonomus grandis grandis]
MASHQTHGIQQLLVAEKRAAEKVAEARKRKVKRIKQARDEAQAEIEAYRRERERQFREYEAKHMGSKEDVAAKINKDTETYLRNMEKLVEDNKDKVIEELISLCVDITPEAHPNFFVMRTFNSI